MDMKLGGIPENEVVLAGGKVSSSVVSTSRSLQMTTHRHSSALWTLHLLQFLVRTDIDAKAALCPIDRHGLRVLVKNRLALTRKRFPLNSPRTSTVMVSDLKFIAAQTHPATVTYCGAPHHRPAQTYRPRPCRAEEGANDSHDRYRSPPSLGRITSCPKSRMGRTSSYVISNDIS